ncbi:MAG: CoA ester lyase [Acetobacteraceae bacterium]|nr:CoA ester lyase [Acetobacteraceae bacterium]
MPDLSLVRSLLFTPADRPERFAKGPASGADGVILDLEDGVGLPAKPAARKAALAFLAAPAAAPAGFVWAVRLNHVTRAGGLDDLQALRAAAVKPAVVVLPKTESVTEVEIALAHLSDDGAKTPAVVAMIETGRGLGAAQRIAAHPAVAVLAFGGADLAADLHATMEWEPMLFARSRIVQAAASAGVAAWDVPFLDIHDADGLRRETAASKAVGYVCKLAIHPSQIAAINAAFTPSSAELARAERVVAAFEAAHGGACQLDGRMIDAPVVKAARRTVALAAHAA